MSSWEDVLWRRIMDAFPEPELPPLPVKPFAPVLLDNDHEYVVSGPADWPVRPVAPTGYMVASWEDGIPIFAVPGQVLTPDT
jgi:hypothetical protein